MVTSTQYSGVKPSACRLSGKMTFTSEPLREASTSSDEVVSVHCAVLLVVTVKDALFSEAFTVTLEAESSTDSGFCVILKVFSPNPSQAAVGRR